jgi:hypothetical protein
VLPRRPVGPLPTPAHRHVKPNTHRKTTRLILRHPIRNRNRRCLRGRRRGPGDLSQALTALGRAVRAHRRLARFAPSFFDSAVVAREAENRAEQRRWMASWEPALAQAYGGAPRSPGLTHELPPLPSPRLQREVDRQLAEREMWLAAGHAALERHQQRQPHALLSWSRMARLLQLGFDFGKLACGLESPNPVPEKLVYDYELTDLQRAYGFQPATPAVAAAASVPAPSASASAAAVAMDPQAAPALPPAPPVPPRCDAWSRWARTRHRMKP